MKRIIETIKIYLSAIYTLTSSYAVVGNLKTVIDKDGLYSVLYKGQVRFSATSDDCYTAIMVNGVIIDVIYHANNSGVAILNTPCMMYVPKIKLKAGDIVSIQAKYSDAGGEIYYEANVRTPFLAIIKEG